jgi:hypothetical protein
MRYIKSTVIGIDIDCNRILERFKTFKNKIRVLVMGLIITGEDEKASLNRMLPELLKTLSKEETAS